MTWSCYCYWKLRKSLFKESPDSYLTYCLCQCTYIRYITIGILRSLCHFPFCKSAFSSSTLQSKPTCRGTWLRTACLKKSLMSLIWPKTRLHFQYAFIILFMSSRISPPYTIFILHLTDIVQFNCYISLFTYGSLLHCNVFRFKQV